MYESFYKLDPTPFRLTPDPHFYFNSATHERGFSFLRYAFHQGEGFVVITGAPGTGKTELMLNLIQELPHSKTTLAKIVTSNLNADDLLDMVASSFLLSPQTSSKGMLLKSLEEFFIAQTRMGKQVLLLIDEAHNLSTSALIELSMLSNFQIEEKPVLQCFLMGQPRLEAKLEQPELAHLKQRVVVSTHLEAFYERETQAYIEHRLTKAGWQGDPEFSDKAYSLIHQFSDGIPRKINALCSRVLLEAYLEEAHHIGIKLVSKIIEEIQEEVVASQMKLDLDFAHMGKSPAKTLVEENTMELSDESTLAPELQFPQKTSATNVIDVTRFSNKEEIQSRSVNWQKSVKPQIDDGFLDSISEKNFDEIPLIKNLKSEHQDIGITNNDNVHTFPLNRKTNVHNESGTSRHTVTQNPENPSAQSQKENQSIQHQAEDLKSSISANQKTVTSDRQSGLLDKELRALASWYTPPAQEKGKDSISQNDTPPVTTKIIVDDLVRQEYELGTNSDNTIETENNTSLIGTADWLPISRFGIAISTASLVLLWWFTYGPGVDYTIQMFETLNSTIESLINSH